MARLNLVAWNAYTANSDDNVIAALSTWTFRHDPDVIALSEATTHADALTEWAELGKGGSDHHGRFYRFTA